MTRGNGERVLFPRRVLHSLLQHASAGAPLEVCGLLAGRGDRVEKAFRLTNIAGRSDYFTADPNEQMEAYLQMLDEGLDSIGIYHSHPETPARPSAEDIANANDPDAVHVIVSLLGPEAPHARAFRIRDGAATEITIETTED